MEKIEATSISTSNGRCISANTLPVKYKTQSTNQSIKTILYKTKKNVLNFKNEI